MIEPAVTNGETAEASLVAPRNSESRPIFAILDSCVPYLFSLTLFANSLLLFCVEPLIAKLLLPLLGGVPAVWNTCLVFFQGVLLFGYIFSFAASKLVGRGKQVALQSLAVAAPLLVLPIVIDGAIAERFARLGPSVQALAVLTVSAGLPLFALSTAAPTLQRWYSMTAAKGTKDPYSLYAASNLGSLGGLLVYPLLLEPYVGLSQQTTLFRGGYLAAALLTLICALAMWQANPVASTKSSIGTRAPCVATPVSSTGRDRALWLFLSAVPSAYLVAVTAHLTTDVTPAPFLWVLPLAAYLLSFVLVFAARPLLSQRTVVRYFPIPAAFATYLIASAQGRPLSMVGIPAHVLAFFAACMLCHGELVRRKPSVDGLNAFYVWVSIGGCLGGVVVTLVAPQVLPFQIEYPICLVLSLLARSLCAPESRFFARDACLPACVLVATAVLAASMPRMMPTGLADAVFALPALFLLFRSRRRPILFAVCVAALLIGSSFRPAALFGEVLKRSRNFFGVVLVKRDLNEHSVALMHGTTLHGAQSQIPRLRRTATTYYSRLGPVGDAFNVYATVPNLPQRVAVIGLGAGTLATYARPGEEWTFFEINPAVVQIATDPSLFTFLSDAFPGGRHLSLIAGDARLKLGEAVGNYGILLIDAFSADSVPVHLLTEEALELYASKTVASGLIALHISNRYIELAPVLSKLAAAKGFIALRRLDVPDEHEQTVDAGRVASEWVVMSRAPSTLAHFSKNWSRLTASGNGRPWTDDRSSVLSVLKF